MTTVIVTYKLPKALPRSTVLERFKVAAETKFKGMPGLHSKQFCYDEKTGNGLSVYLWQSKEQAKAFFTPEFQASFESIFGVKPDFEILDTLLVVDNRVDDITVNAA